MKYGQSVKVAIARLRSLQSQLHNIPEISVQVEIEEVIELLTQLDAAGELDIEVRRLAITVIGQLLERWPDIQRLLRDLFGD